MAEVLDLRRAVWLAMVCLASPCAAQVGAPTPQDILENNLNALRGPVPGAQPRVGPPTPQQSLDRNIDSLRSPGLPRNAPTEQYYPASPLKGPSHHPGADSLLSPTGVELTAPGGGQRTGARTGRRKVRTTR